jgi:hypothetical protein
MYLLQNIQLIKKHLLQNIQLIWIKSSTKYTADKAATTEIKKKKRKITSFNRYKKYKKNIENIEKNIW